MGEVRSRLTVYFEEPFWIGVFESYQDGNLSVSKVTFGAEPKDYEVNEFIQNHYYDLKFSPAVQTVVKESHHNPKRIQRSIKKSLEKKGIGTRSQEALKLQQEKNKQERKVKSRLQKLSDAEHLFEMKQQKNKEKHRGR